MILEGDETFDVSLTASTALVDDSDTAVGTITNDDNAAVTVEDITAGEGNDLVFTLTLDNPVQDGFDVTVSFADDTATGGNVDYDSAQQTVSFVGNSAGETQQVTVTSVADGIVESPETFDVSLSATNADVDVSDTAIGTITDGDSAAVTIENVSADEGDDLVFTVTLNNPVAGGFDVTVSFADDTAAGGNVDYDSAQQIVSFVGNIAGETQQLTVTSVEDLILEGDETFDVSLTASTALVDDSDTAVGTITNDDNAAVTVEDITAGEGNDLVFTLTLDNPVQDGFDVTVSFADDTATGGNVDYDSAQQTVSFVGNSAGETQQVTVTSVADGIVESPETFDVSLSATNADVDVSDTAIGTITDGDSAAVTIENVSADEGDDLVFTVTLNNPVAGGFDVTVSFADDTAAGGNVDYDSAQQIVSFVGNIAGETQQLTVTSVEDLILEGDETFDVSLTASTALVDDSDTAVGTITNDDNAAVTVEDITAGEGNDLVFTLTLDNPVQDGFDVTVSFADDTATGGNVDYDSAQQTVSFVGNSAGETQQVTVTSVADGIVESPETFDVSLSATNADVDVSDTAIGTITDGDSAAVTIENVSADEGDDLVFTVTLNNPVAGGFDVTVSFADDTAAGGNVDYDSAQQIVSFVGNIAGETQQLTVTSVEDLILEGDETFDVSLTASTALVDDSDTAVGTITNDDNAAVTVEDITAGEGNDLVFTLTLDNPVQDGFDVTVSFADDTATGGNVDYDSAQQTVSFCRQLRG